MKPTTTFNNWVTLKIPLKIAWHLYCTAQMLQIAINLNQAKSLLWNENIAVLYKKNYRIRSVANVFQSILSWWQKDENSGNKYHIKRTAVVTN